MVNNFLCQVCDKAEVCKLMDILKKFHEDAKTPLGVDITIDKCLNFLKIEEE